MESKELSINTLNVEIKVLKVGGKSFTKAVFNQLLNYPFDIEFKPIEHDLIEIEFEGDYLGFVYANSETYSGKRKIGIFNYEGMLYKLDFWDYDQYADTCILCKASFQLFIAT